jgi:hypothetical protein
MEKADLKNALQVLANELTRANTHFHFAKHLHANYVQLPEDASLGDIAREIEFVNAAQEGFAELDRASGFRSKRSSASCHPELSSSLERV